jgi:hypothetical protein
MGMIWADSFDGYLQDMFPRWTAGGGAYAGGGPGPGGRDGTNAMNIYNSATFKLIMEPALYGAIMGFAFEYQGNLVGGGPTDSNLAQFMVETPQLGAVNVVSLQINAMGGFTLVDATNTITNSINDLYFQNAWGHIQFKFDGTYATVLYNSISIGLDNVPVSWPVPPPIYPHVINVLGLQWGSFAASVAYDDFYVIDINDGINPVDFVGDLYISAIFPNASGSHSNFLPSATGSPQNYTMVDENPQNLDTDYVYTAASGAMDTYNFPDFTLPAGSQIYGVMHNVVARKDNPGMRAMGMVCRSASGDYLETPYGGWHTMSPTDGAYLGDSYHMFSWCWPVDPATGLQWTPALVNQAQFGQKVTK